jgi:thiol-disulfide isomerase/thioredoxin
MNGNLLAAISAAGLIFGLTSLSAENLEVSKTAPGWTLRNLEGKPVKLSDFKGKVVLLNFWATWCPPCREDIPELIALQKQYAPQGLVVVGVSMDEGGAAGVARFLKSKEINYPIVMGTPELAEAYGGIEVLPTTFLIDRDGRIVDGLEGATDRAGFEEKLRPLFPAPESTPAKSR